jgi:hypothetical protein
MEQVLAPRYGEETISNSGLAALSVSPRVYRNYKDRVEQATASYFNLGSATHCRILEPAEFNDRYIVSNIVAPGGMYAKFIDTLFRTRKKDGGEYEGLQHATWVANAYGDSGFKWPMDKVWNNFLNDPELKGYYDALLKTSDKILLSQNDEKAIEACVKGTQTHERAAELLYGYMLSTCRNEFEVIWRHPEHPWFMMKSIFDRVIIDDATKTAILVDLKTTSKPVGSFIHSYRKYDYHRQMALYRVALKWYLENEHVMPTGEKPNVDEWKFEIYIVATQTNGYGDTAVYTPAEKDLEKGLVDADKLLHRMKWHFDNDKWDHPMEYYTNNGVITLNLDEYQNSQSYD